jgi:hypothetical protein
MWKMLSNRMQYFYSINALSEWECDPNSRYQACAKHRVSNRSSAMIMNFLVTDVFLSRVGGKIHNHGPCPGVLGL